MKWNNIHYGNSDTEKVASWKNFWEDLPYRMKEKLNCALDLISYFTFALKVHETCGRPIKHENNEVDGRSEVKIFPSNVAWLSDTWTRVPFTESYVTHRRVSVGGGSEEIHELCRQICAWEELLHAGRTIYSRTVLDCWQNVVYRPWIWWMNPRRSKGDDTLSTLSTPYSHVVLIHRAFRIIRGRVAYLHTGRTPPWRGPLETIESPFQLNRAD